MAPEGYERMRDKFIKEGLSKDKAQEKSAKIWNKNNPDNPITKKHEEKTLTEPGGMNGGSVKILDED